MIAITQASLADVADIAPLFDAYRQFYEQPADLALATEYLTQRLSAEESTIFLARNADGDTVGFTQLYPTYCSVAAQRMWVLYDLFVAPSARRHGVAMKLMETAQALGADTQAAFLKLETAHTNIPGQTLYERMGWEKDAEFLTYTYSPGAP